MLPLHKELKEKLLARFAEYGFKRSADLDMKKTVDGIRQTIGISIYHNGIKNVSFLCPMIIVMPIEAEKLLKQIYSIKTSIRNMLIEPIGYLMPRHSFCEWRFELNSPENDANFNDMVNAIIAYGFLYFESLSDTQKIIHALEEMGKNPTFLYPYSRLLPVMYYLNGEKEKALDIIHRHIHYLDERHLEDIRELIKENKTYSVEDKSITTSRNLMSYMSFVSKYKEICK